VSTGHVAELMFKSVHTTTRSLPNTISMPLCDYAGACREAWGERLAQLKQQELQEIADARHKAQEVRRWFHGMDDKGHCLY
jgi:hypothetical protein